MSPTPPLETYPDVIPIIDGVVRNASDPENAIAIEMAAIMMAAMVSSREEEMNSLMEMEAAAGGGWMR